VQNTKWASPAHRGNGGEARELDPLRQTIEFRRSIPPVRLQRLVARLHALGPRATFELLREIAAGADLFSRLEAYAKLDPNTLRALSGDALPIDRLFVIDGDGS